MRVGHKIAGMLGGLGLLGALVAPVANAEPQQLSWGDCPADVFVTKRAKCAEFQVPMDYSQPDGQKITLTMSKIPATGTKRGVIAGNPGGPGGSALEMFADNAAPDKLTGQRVKLPADVQEHYDLIAVQPRGLAHGETLNCSYGHLASGVIPTLAAGLFRDLCDLEQPGYSQQVTTANTARDLDRARQLLGEDRLNLYGVSYGGVLMGTYATMFPQHTGKALIDSSASPESLWFKTGRDRESWRRDGLHDVFQWIADRDDEYHLGTTPLQVYQRWSAVIDKESGVPAQVTPPPAEIGDLPAGLKEHANVVLPAANQALPPAWRLGSAMATLAKGKQQATLASPLFTFTYFGALYNPEMRPKLAEYIRTGKQPKMEGQEVGPNGRPVNPVTGKELSEEETMGLLEQMTSLGSVERSIVCNDNATPTKPEMLPQLFIDELTGGDSISAIEGNLGSGRVCAGWPLPHPGAPINGEKLETKPLHVGFTNDSAVTGDAIWQMQKALGGEAVQVPGHAHGVMLVSPEKVAGKVSAYFNG